MSQGPANRGAGSRDSTAQSPNPNLASRIPNPGLLLALLALCGFLFFWRLGVTPLDDFDEAYYAEGAREMIQRGDLLTPYYNGQPFLLKPILIYWLIAAAFHLFGVTEFAARSVSAFSATLIVLATCWFGSRTLGARAGLLAGLILALCYLWVDTGREAMIDMPLTAALAPALFLFFLGTQRVAQASACGIPQEGILKPAPPLLLAYPLLGLALLAKGPAGLVSLLGLVGYLLSNKIRKSKAESPPFHPDSRTSNLEPPPSHPDSLMRSPGFVRRSYLLPGLALVAAVAGPWYLYESITQPGFLQTFLLREHFGHLQGELARDDAWWGHLKNLLVGLYPWALFLPAALAYAFRRLPDRDALRFCGWWALTVVVLFSFAGAKLPHYLVPAFPPMAILIAAWFDAWIAGRAATRSPEWLAFGLLALIGSAAGALAVLAGLPGLMPPVVRDRIAAQFGAWTPGPAPVVMLAALAAGSLLAVAAALLGRRSAPASGQGAPPARRAVFPVLAGAMLVALVAHVGWFKPRLALIQAQPRKELAQLASLALPPDEPLAVFYAKRNATIFYARRPIVDLGEWEPESLVDFLSAPAPATALTHARFLPLLQQKLPHTCLWTRRGDFILVSNHPLPIFDAARATRSP